MPSDVLKVIIPPIISFVIGILITPMIAHFLYKHKMWKKQGGKRAMDGSEAKVFNSLHADGEAKTPRMGGLVIWISAFLTIALLWILSKLIPTAATLKLEFLSRSQTWIPLSTLLLGGIVGLINDLIDVKESGKEIPKGLSLKKRLVIITLAALGIGGWLYFKLGITGIGIPGDGVLYLGALIIPFFILVTWGIYAGGVIDGIDGLAGGVFAIIFAGYAAIAFGQGQLNLAAFCTMLVGSILAFLWFNVPPARFYMTETGTMALTITLAAVAFMTDTLGDGVGVAVLPIIALPLVLTVLSDIIQIGSKKLRGKKVFHAAPIHHHFEAIGWSREKITMRYWIVGSVVAVAGVIIALVG